jgi:hypothetical protein
LSEPVTHIPGPHGTQSTRCGCGDLLDAAGRAVEHRFTTIDDLNGMSVFAAVAETTSFARVLRTLPRVLPLLSAAAARIAGAAGADRAGSPLAPGRPKPLEHQTVHS